MSGKEKCELCQHPFSFTKLYASDAPSKLPLREFFWGLVVKGSRSLRFGIRVLIVLVTWLCIAPTLTCWLWRVSFMRSFAQGAATIVQRFEPVLVLADCIQGLVISCCLICAVLFCSAAWDYMLQYWVALAPTILPPIETDDPGVNTQLEATASGPGADASEATSSAHASEGSGGVAVTTEGSSEGEGWSTASDDGWAGDEAASSSGRTDERDLRRRSRRLQAGSQAGQPSSGPPTGQVDEGGDGVQQQGANAAQDEPPAAAAPAQAAAVPAAAAVAPAAPAAPPGGDDFREVDFDALLGLQGPLIGLFENAAMIVLLAATMLFAAFLLPFTVGRLALSALANLQPDQAASVLNALANDPARLHHTGAPASRENATESVALPEGFNGVEMSGVAGAIMVFEQVIKELEVHLAQPTITDWAVLMVGYIVVGCLALAGLWTYLAWKVVRSGRRGRGLAWAKHALTMAGRQFRAYLIRVGFAAKVVSILLTELALLPIAHGYFLHMCAWPLVHTRPAISFGLSFVLLHWLLGMGFLMATAGFLSITRSILRPGALPFIRDPYDMDNEEPFGQLMTAPMRDQMVRAAAAFAVMACLAVVCIHVPIRAATVLAPALFPLRLKLVDALVELPADLLLFHVCLPLTLPHLHLRRAVRQALSWWLRKAAWLLDLEHYLLRPPPGQPTAQQGAPRLLGVANGIDRIDVNMVGDVDGTEGLEGRLLALLGLLIATAMTGVTAGILLPLLTGRQLLTLLNVPLRHDMYVIAAGCYSLWASCKAAAWLWRVTSSSNLAGVVRKLGKGLWAGACGAALLVAALGLLPLMAGLLCDLVLAPFRVPPKAMPALLLQQDWALGLVLLKFVHHLIAGIPDGRHGLLGRPLRDTFAHLVAPPLQALAALLAVPYLLTRGLLPLTGLPATALHVCWTWAYFVEVAGILLAVAVHYAALKAQQLRRAIHEERYLVGRQLNNLVPTPAVGDGNSAIAS
ncbi:g10383 [Coccomyxa elongata]